LPLIGLSLVIQLLCAVHCVRNGRNSMWLMVIIVLLIPGCLAYAFFEILPQYSGSRQVRAAKAVAIRKLDPERDLRAARDALDLSDTAAHRVALGDAMVEMGNHTEAIPHYREAMAKAPAGDRATQLKLARAELEGGDSEVKTLLETLPPSGSASENDRAALFLARAAEECGETDRALSLYADLGRRLPGGEAQCRQAALLIAKGREEEAVSVLTEVEHRVKRLDRFERAKHAEMYAWASRTPAEYGPARL